MLRFCFTVVHSLSQSHFRRNVLAPTSRTKHQTTSLRCFLNIPMQLPPSITVGFFKYTGAFARRLWLCDHKDKYEHLATAFRLFSLIGSKATSQIIFCSFHCLVSGIGIYKTLSALTCLPICLRIFSDLNGLRCIVHFSVPAECSTILAFAWREKHLPKQLLLLIWFFKQIRHCKALPSPV